MGCDLGSLPGHAYMLHAHVLHLHRVNNCQESLESDVLYFINIHKDDDLEKERATLCRGHFKV